MSANLGRVFDIQKFSLHDGPGIRTVVFLKGCPMRCSWCSNPNSQRLAVLPMRDTTTGDRTVPDSRDYPTEEVIEICLQDLPFYQESGGGVTLSGGEVLVQHRFAARLLAQLHDLDIHTAIETTGYAAAAVFQRTLELSDLAIIDVKHHDPVEHRRWTGVSNEIPLRNLATALASHTQVLVRIPVIPGVNNSTADAAAFCRTLLPLGVRRLQLLPFHQFGARKYELLGWDYTMADLPALHEEDLAEFAATFAENGIQAEF